MNESEFNDRVDETLQTIELALDLASGEVDYESGGGVLTVEFDNGTTLVFSRQSAARQLWLAARSGGFHFEYDAAAGDWRNTRGGELLLPFVAATCREQGGVDVDL